MTAEDVRKLREFFDSPAGKRMLGEINKAFDVPPMSIDQPEAFWRDMDGNRIEAEAYCADPLDPLRPFPAPRPTSPPIPVDHRVSPRFVIIAAILSTIACAGVIAWFVSAALKAHS